MPQRKDNNETIINTKLQRVLLVNSRYCKCQYKVILPFGWNINTPLPAD